MRRVSPSMYNTGRVIGLLIACTIVGAVVGAIIGPFTGHGLARGVLNGAGTGAEYGIGFGVVFFLWGMLVVLRNALRGDYRRERAHAAYLREKAAYDAAYQQEYDAWQRSQEPEKT